MRTDTIFYQLFQTLPSIFFELIGQPAAEAEAYQFTSVEVKTMTREDLEREVSEAARKM